MVFFSRAAFLTGADVVITADTDAAGTVVDVGASLDLLEAAAFARTRGRPALSRGSRAVALEDLQAALGLALLVAVAVGAILEVGWSGSHCDLLYGLVIVVGPR